MTTFSKTNARFTQQIMSKTYEYIGEVDFLSGKTGKLREYHKKCGGLSPDMCFFFPDDKTIQAHRVKRSNLRLITPHKHYEYDDGLTREGQNGNDQGICGTDSGERREREREREPERDAQNRIISG